MIPLELSGRGSRFDEPLYNNIEEAVNDVYSMICDNIENSDYAIFGYSLGSLLSYEACCLMKKTYKKLPSHLFMASMGTPDISYSFKKFGSNVDDENLLNYVIGNNGVSPELVKNNMFNKVFFPVIKSDFKMIFDYMPKNEIALDIDITAIYGNKDIEVEKNIKGWGKYTTKELKIYELDGDHFFINQQYENVVQIIRDTLVHN